MSDQVENNGNKKMTKGSEIKKIADKVLDIIAEIESYEFYKKSLIESVNKFTEDYGNGKYTKEEYEKLIEGVLKGKSQEDWVKYYNSYIYSLLKKIEPLISQIICYVYEGKEPLEQFVEIKKPSLKEIIGKKEEAEERIKVEKEKEIKKTEEEIEEIKKHKKIMKEIEEKIKKSKRPSIFRRIIDAWKYKPIKPEKAKAVEYEKEPLFSRLSYSLKRFGRRLFKPKIEIEEIADIKKTNITKKEKVKETKGIEKKQGVFLKLFNIFKAFKVKGIEKKKAVEESKEKAKLEVPLPLEKEPLLKGLMKTLKHTKEPKAVKLKEDKALRKLMENIEKIRQEAPSLKAKPPKESIELKLKLFMIRLHFFIESKRKKKKAPKEIKIPLPEKAPEKIPEKVEIAEKKPTIPFKKRIKDAVKGIYVKAKYSIKKLPEWVSQIGKPKPAVPKAEIPKEKKAEEVKEEKVGMFLRLFSPIREWYRRRAEEEKRFMAPKTKIPPSLQLKKLQREISPLFEEEKITPTLLTEEVTRIRKIISEKRKFKIYEPSYFGSMANILVRRITFYLIDNFPMFFRKLYDSLRLANIRVLSNTYVNIMVLSVILSFIASFFFFLIFFFATKNPWFLTLPKALIMSIIVSAITFILFYMYPSMRAKTRERNINTNLPFAINHISAVAGAGVPPTKMFKLLVETEEYGEIAVELGKIVDYIDVFGYDLITAIRSVSLNTPSAMFKEFLEGIISTIESGSDIKNYLREKASESMLAYELERAKYLETITTYSDVYTGILIAAPLFFIVALSLVSMLGGRIAGLDINLIIIVGAYVVIPLLNIAFIIFIEATQPEM
ncbi:MAG: type II secretion system F family protein [Candidatus Woesearchaeota archaeon]|nr:type II secretion system F family protein [Candidatus Woesearchaeota archaeon]